MQDFRNVDAWKKAHALVLSVYRETQTMPREEVFGVTMQLRRGATAVATRIAEGTGRNNNAEFAADLRRAMASSNELEYLMLLARDLGYWKPELCERLVADAIEVRKMIFGLVRKL
ncbi:MAG TPA: four helix bundle protein [Acidobacteriaceae bacterium]